MRLEAEQKKFIRTNYGKMSVRKMAKRLQVEPKAVRWAMAELGLVPPEVAERRQREARQKKRGQGVRGRFARALGMFKRTQVAFWTVFGLALLLRVLHVVQLPDQPLLSFPQGEAQFQHDWAASIAAGDWKSATQPVFLQAPAYAYLLGGAYFLFGTSAGVAVWLQVFLSTLMAGLVCLLGRRVFGPVAGFMAGLLAVFFAPAMFLTGMVLPETFASMLVVSALVLLFGALKQPRFYKWLGAGILMGLAIAVHAWLVFYLPLALMGIVGWTGIGAARRWAPAGLLLLLGTALAVAPLGLHNRLIGGELVIHSTGFSNSLSSDSWENNEEKLNRTASKLKLYFSAHESDWELNGGPGGELATNSTAMGYGFGLILPLGFLGLLVSIRGFRKRGLLVWFVLVHLGACLVFECDGRLRFMLAPVLIVYTAALLRWLWTKARKREWIALGVTGFFVLAGLVGAYTSPRPAPDGRFQLDSDKALAASKRAEHGAVKSARIQKAKGRVALPKEKPEPAPGAKPNARNQQDGAPADQPDSIRFEAPGRDAPK